jgi:hypothetical protein
MNLLVNEALALANVSMLAESTRLLAEPYPCRQDFAVYPAGGVWSLPLMRRFRTMSSSIFSRRIRARATAILPIATAPMASAPKASAPSAIAPIASAPTARDCLDSCSSAGYAGASPPPGSWLAR